MTDNNIDLETGEVILTEAEEATLNTSLDEIDMVTYVTNVGDIIASKLERAKRYREQAEKRAKPLEKTAEFLLNQIRHWVIELAKQKLPKIQSGDNAGKYRSKTLNLETCSFSFTKDGGTYVADKDRAIKFIMEQKAFPELDDLIDYAPSLTSEAKLLELLQKLKLLDNPVFKEELLGFLSITEVDEFAKVKVKV